MVCRMTLLSSMQSASAVHGSFVPGYGGHFHAVVFSTSLFLIMPFPERFMFLSTRYTSFAADVSPNLRVWPQGQRGTSDRRDH